VLTPAQLIRFHAMREEMGQRILRLRGGAEPGVAPRRLPPPRGRRPGARVFPGVREAPGGSGRVPL
jgi:hypothetical protein